MSRERLPRRLRAAAVTGAVVVAAVGFVAAAAFACGVCDQDKVAATYDYAVVSAATARGHRVLFAELVGRLPAADAARSRRIARAVERVAGVDAGTARVSLFPAAVSLAWDPARTSRTRLLDALGRALGAEGLRLRPIESSLPPGA